jgi:hypothetical protein
LKLLVTAKSDQCGNPIFKISFWPFYPKKAPTAQFCALLGNSPDSTIDAFIGLHGQNLFKITQIAAGVPFHGVEEFFALLQNDNNKNTRRNARMPHRRSGAPFGRQRSREMTYSNVLFST